MSEAHGHSYALWLDANGKLVANFVLGGVARSVASPQSVPIDVWTYVAATYDGQHIRLYINGSEAANLVATGQFEPPATTILSIGSYLDLVDGYRDTFDGDIDELRVYGSALTASAINEDMARSIGASSLLVIGQTPYSGAIGVLSQAITASFTVDMESSSLTQQTVVLETVGGAALASTLQYNAGTRTVTITPTSTLAPMTTYRVRIVAGSEGVAGTQGERLFNERSWTFRSMR